MNKLQIRRKIIVTCACIFSLLLMIYSCDLSHHDEREILEAQKNNVALTHQFFEYFNDHDWVGMSEMYSDPAYFKDPSLGQGIVTQTRSETIEKYSQLQKIFPNLNDEIVQIYPSGKEHVIIEFISRGTGANGLEFQGPFCMILTFQKGKITKDFTYYDN